MATAMILVATTLFTACGFQLRGAAELPAAMERTYIRTPDASTGFVRDLERQLTANGVQVVASQSEATGILDIPVARMRRQALTISGAAQVREYQLRFEVRYRLVDADGEEIIPFDTAVLRRDYSFDEREILAATREEEFLEAELHGNMAVNLLRRLEAAGKSK